MIEIWKLSSTYEVLLEIGHTLKPIRIEIFRSQDNQRKFRTRIWEQNTYNLYPTFANILPEGGLENRLMSCDLLNREISIDIAETPEILLGLEWESEEAFLIHLKEAIFRYQSMLTDENA
jgi:hypothetical protein